MQILATGGGPGNIPDFSVATNAFNIRYGVTDITYSESNMRAAWASGASVCILIVPKQYGKWALEMEVVQVSSTGTTRIGIREALSLVASTSGFPSTAGDYGYQSDGQKRNSGGAAAYGATYTTGDKITILWDADSGALSFGKNGTNQGVAYSGLSGAFFPATVTSNGTQDIRISTTNTYAFSGYTQWR